LERWNARSIQAFNRKLWSEEQNIYCSFDLQANKLVELKEVGGVAAVFAGCCPKERIARMASELAALRDQGFLLVPSFDPKAPGFDPKRYWRGPVWPQMNWLICRGLQENGYEDLAAIVRQDFLDLVEAFGFREYFDPRREILKKGHGGYGGDRFSWTASSYLDLTYD
jgi:glycogen debranching enzyme